jgi:hypothetical protein
MQSRPKLILKNSSTWRFMPLVGLIPFIITVAALGIAYFTGTPREELETPFLGMGIMSLSISGMFLLVALVSRGIERGRINGTYNDCWAGWPQFTPQGWQAFAESEWQREQRAKNYSWLSVIMILIIFPAIGLFTVFYMKAVLLEVLVPLGAFMVIMLVILLGSSVSQQMAKRGRYNRRVSAPTPSTYVSKGGIYDEDKGFESLRGLQRVDYLPPQMAQEYQANIYNLYNGIGPRQWNLTTYDIADVIDPRSPEAQWAQLQFTVRRHQRYYNYTAVIAVRVPPGREGEAQAVVQRFQAERFAGG